MDGWFAPGFLAHCSLAETGLSTHPLHSDSLDDA